MRGLVIRVGLASAFGRMPFEMEKRELPVLVSANSLFDHGNNAFREVPPNVWDLDVALDSAGFVAMSRYGRFPWTVGQYVDLAMSHPWTWWSQLDCCCEPEVAHDRSTVMARVKATYDLLRLCRQRYRESIELAPELAQHTSWPMPVLQGWQPEDYLWSIDYANVALNGRWPAMIGVGSVCRRKLGGEDGLWRVLDRIDRHLPAGVKLHLFGVKGAALSGLGDFPRVASVDSMAFEFAARVRCRERGVSKTIAERAASLDQWVQRQTGQAASSPQMRFDFGPVTA